MKKTWLIQSAYSYALISKNSGAYGRFNWKGKIPLVKFIPHEQHNNLVQAVFGKGRSLVAHEHIEKFVTGEEAQKMIERGGTEHE